MKRIGLACLISLVLLGPFFISDDMVKPFQIEHLLPPGNIERIAYEEYKKKFDDERSIFVTISSQADLTLPQLISLQKKLNKKLMQLGIVASIESLSKAEFFTIDDSGLKIQPFINYENQLTKLGRETLNLSQLKGMYLNTNNNTLVSSVNLRKQPWKKSEFLFIDSFLQTLNQFESENPEVVISTVGTKIVRYYFAKEVERNQKIIFPLLIVIIALFILYCFGSFTIVFYCILIMLLSYCLLFSFVIIYSGGVTPYSGFSLIFVVVVATADLIHFFSRFVRIASKSLSERLREVKQKLLLPCFLTTVTTIGGFLSLILSSSVPVKEFGIFCSAGSVFCFVLTFYFLPIIIEAFTKSFCPNQRLIQKRFTRWIIAALRFRKPIIWLSISLVLLCVWNASKIRFGDSFYRKFMNHHPLSLHIERITTALGYVGTIDIVAENLPLQHQKIDFWKKIESITKEIKSHRLVFNVQSPYLYLEILQANPPYNRPQVLNFAALAVLNSFRVFEKFTSSSNKETRFITHVKSFDNRDFYNLRQYINLIGFKHDVNLSLAGFAAVRENIFRQISKNLTLSFSFSFFFIFLIFLIILRSPRLSILGLIPNLMPLLIVAGVFGWAELEIENNLILLVCVILTIAVDDTIHFLIRYQRERVSARKDDAVRRALEQASPALITTTLTFAVAMPVFLLSNLVLFVQVSVFLILGLLFALLFDLLLLPSILLSLKDPQD